MTAWYKVQNLIVCHMYSIIALFNLCKELKLTVCCINPFLNKKKNQEGVIEYNYNNNNNKLSSSVEI